MLHPPALRISCSRAPDVNVGHAVRSGVFISNEDVRLLRRLAERDISVHFVCAGHLIYEGQVRSVVRSITRKGNLNHWYVPTGTHGPLKPTRLWPLVD
jgi:hypothetical protein